MAGGYGAWKRAGLPIDQAVHLHAGAEVALRAPPDAARGRRGRAGQAARRPRCCCSAPAGSARRPGLYLAAAGVGTLGLVDDDVVDESNLQRQVIHNTTRVGMPKVESAAQTINELNPDVKVRTHQLRLTSENVLDVIKDYDLIVDGTDNFQTRYLLNDASLMLKKPVVNASIFQFEGQVTVFKPFEGPCYRCLYPEPPPPGMAPSCNEAGVLGVLPGVIGVLQATEAVKLILGIGKPLVGRLLQYDALNMKFREFKLPRDPKCVVCSEPGKKIELIDYEAFCVDRKRERRLPFDCGSDICGVIGVGSTVGNYQVAAEDRRRARWATVFLAAPSGHRQARRAQGHPPRAGGERGDGRALLQRGARGHPDRPREHRRGAGLRADARRRQLHRHGAARGRIARRQAQARGRALGRRAPCTSRCSSPTGWRRRTRAASSIATSSPTTSSSSRAAAIPTSSRSSTSASPS